MANNEDQQNLFEENEGVLKLSQHGREELEGVVDKFEQGDETTEKIINLLNSDAGFGEILKTLKTPLLQKAYPDIIGDKAKEEALIDGLIELVKDKLSKIQDEEKKVDLQGLLGKLEATRNESLKEGFSEIEDAEKLLKKVEENIKKGEAFKDEFGKSVIDSKEAEETVKKLKEILNEKAGRKLHSITKMEQRILGSANSISSQINKLKSDVRSLNSNKLKERFKAAGKLIGQVETEAKSLNSENINNIIDKIKREFETATQYIESINGDKRLITSEQNTAINNLNGVIFTSEIRAEFKQLKKSEQNTFTSQINYAQFKSLSALLENQNTQLENKLSQSESNLNKFTENRVEAAKETEDFEKRMETCKLKPEHDLYKDVYKDAALFEWKQIPAEKQYIENNFKAVRDSLHILVMAHDLHKQWDRIGVGTEKDRVADSLRDVQKMYKIIKEKNIPLTEKISIKTPEGEEKSVTLEEAILKLSDSEFTHEKTEQSLSALIREREDLIKYEAKIIDSLEKGDMQDFTEAETKLRQGYQAIAAKEIEYFGSTNAVEVRVKVAEKMKEMDRLFDKAKGKNTGEREKLENELNEKLKKLIKERTDLTKELDLLTDESKRPETQMQLRGIMDQISNVKKYLEEMSRQETIYRKSTPMMSKEEAETKQDKLKKELDKKNQERYLGTGWFPGRNIAKIYGHMRLPTVTNLIYPKGTRNILKSFFTLQSNNSVIAEHTIKRNVEAMNLLTRLKEEQLVIPSNKLWLISKPKEIVRDFVNGYRRASISQHQKVIRNLSRHMEKGYNLWGQAEAAQKRLDKYKEKYKHVIPQGEQVTHMKQIQNRLEINELQRKITEAASEGNDSEVLNLYNKIKTYEKEIKDTLDSIKNNEKAIADLSKPEFLKGTAETRAEAEKALKESESQDKKRVDEFVSRLQKAGLDETVYPSRYKEEDFKEWLKIIKYTFIPMNFENTVIKPFTQFVKNKAQTDGYVLVPEDVKILLKIYNDSGTQVLNETFFRRKFVSSGSSNIRTWLDSENQTS